MSEAALFSVPISKVYLARDENRSGGGRLAAIKENMQRPISALVILNNLINILGSVMVGYKAADVLGNDWKGYFAGSLTFLIIVFSEIIPKTVGERYNLRVSLLVATPEIADRDMERRVYVGAGHTHEELARVYV